MTTKVSNRIKDLLCRDFSVRNIHTYISNSGAIYWSWGVSRIMDFLGAGLVYHVNGRKFKGYVAVTLAASDTFTITLITARGKEVKRVEYVYVQNLIEVLDHEIETD